MDQIFTAIIIAIVEGITEFLPISSTGHMILVGNIIGFHGEQASLFEVVIQFGAILSVVYIYKEKFKHFFTKDGWNANKGLSAWHVAAGIVPVMLIAFFAHGFIKKYLFSPNTVIVGLVLGGVLMLVAERYALKNQLQEVDKISIEQAFWVGFFQVLALWPGFSRSGSTLSGGLLLGLSRKVAAEFTFIIAVPVMFIASVYDLYKNKHLLNSESITMLSIGCVVAFITSWFAVLWLIKFLNKSSLKSFAIYRFVLALLSFWYFN